MFALWTGFTFVGFFTPITDLGAREEAEMRRTFNLGVGMAGAKSVAREIRDGKLISWLIEGAEIKWELGLARLRGGHFSPIG